MARARSVSAKQRPGWNATWARHADGTTAMKLSPARELDQSASPYSNALLLSSGSTLTSNLLPAS